MTFRHWYFGSMHEDRTVTPRHTALFRRVLPAGQDLSGLEQPEEPVRLEPEEMTPPPEIGDPQPEQDALEPEQGAPEPQASAPAAQGAEPRQAVT